MKTDHAAFDAVAGAYDDDFTSSILGRLLRPRVWEKLSQYFSSGEHVLELACGTGEDAVWLAQQGLRVTATDGSAEMIEVTQAKVDRAGVTGQVEARQVSLQAISEKYFNKPFDGVFSNFGGLNTINQWRSLAQALAEIVRSGGKVILVPMGPFCPWEIGWYLAHGQPKMAFRRFSVPASARIGETVIPVWYPSARRLRADFAPWFRYCGVESLGLWLPPSYLDHFVNRRPNFFVRLDQFEKATARLTTGWGDHYIIIFERR